MRRTLSILDIHVHEIFAWSDSEIVLAWIPKDPSTWITYIANRVAKIHQNLPRDVWNHVASADVASRGISASDFKNHRLWWRGPSWLRQDPEWWPINNRDEHLFHFEQQIMENQNTHFSLSMFRSPEDIDDLKKSRPVSSKSKLKDLNPILEDGLLKVGGRIQNSELPSRDKNPIILPKCHTTYTIFKEIHCEMLRGGLQLTINRLRMEY
uniref:Uncharacterized protein n=1 Tax=Phlebotomus papatasi TaxID=29031 RepID=A0A1B0DL54_PHLPP